MAKKKDTNELLKTAGLAALAGAYFLYGSKNAKKNRNKVKIWALRAKADVLEQMEKIPKLEEKEYKKILDSVRARYEKTKKVSVKELNDFTKELQGHWKNLAKELKKTK